MMKGAPIGGLSGSVFLALVELKLTVCTDLACTDLALVATTAVPAAAAGTASIADLRDIPPMVRPFSHALHDGRYEQGGVDGWVFSPPPGGWAERGEARDVPHRSVAGDSP
jgi:hypothetical protein